jgi:methionyl-tRNA formyltransferase
MRIVFLGNAGFGIPVLRAFAGNHEVAAVVTRPDREEGRGRKLRPSPVKEAALALGLETIEVERLRDESFIRRLHGLEADLFFVVAFRILPREVFAIPPLGTINLHASLLPDYRGAAPINWAIINGDPMTGLTTFYIEETVDTGDVILNEPVAIDPDETAGELAARMSDKGASLALKTIDLIGRGGASGLRQPLRGGRPAPKLFKEDGLIDWTGDALAIHNRVRGMNPAPGAFTVRDGTPLKIHRTKPLDEAPSGDPGRSVEASPRGGLAVACGKGVLRILELQPPGKRPMDGPSFVRGYRVEAGTYIASPAAAEAG